MRILGIDPGLNATGYGVIDSQAGQFTVVTAGDIRPKATEELGCRLAFIHDALVELIRQHRPAVAVLEKIFTHHAYITTATLMGHARGVACLAAQEQGLILAEYPPTQVKKSVSGNGAASKEQVARMVGQWLGVREVTWSADATDALALAIVHAHAQSAQRRLPAGVTG